MFIHLKKSKFNKLHRFLDVVCGLAHSIALTEDKHVYSWGAANGKLGHGDR